MANGFVKPGQLVCLLVVRLTTRESPELREPGMNYRTFPIARITHGCAEIVRRIHVLHFLVI